MKSIEVKSIDGMPGREIKAGEPFSFSCHPGVSCFNKCCRNLNLFLYPYDVVRLKNHFEITSDEFIDKYVDVVLREGNHFPEVLLKMADNEEKTCPFLTDEGCSVYPDRPDACRTFPVEHGVEYKNGKVSRTIHFFKPPEFCMGKFEKQTWTLENWAKDQDAVTYNKMTILWGELKGYFAEDPWNGLGPDCQKGKMAFMATYNTDQFRNFLFNSSFLKRYKVKSDLLKKIKRNDAELMKFGFEWTKMVVWGIPTKKIRPR